MRIYCLDGIGTHGRVDGSILAHTADHLAGLTYGGAQCIGQ